MPRDEDCVLPGVAPDSHIRQNVRVRQAIDAPTPGASEVAPPVGISDVHIKKAENGFILHIGCKTFIANNWEDASTGIGMYFKNPVDAQKKYCT